MMLMVFLARLIGVDRLVGWARRLVWLLFLLVTGLRQRDASAGMARQSP